MLDDELLPRPRPGTPRYDVEQALMLTDAASRILRSRLTETPDYVPGPINEALEKVDAAVAEVSRLQILVSLPDALEAAGD